jgi:hypothetical protein
MREDDYLQLCTVPFIPILCASFEVLFKKVSYTVVFLHVCSDHIRAVERDSENQSNYTMCAVNPVASPRPFRMLLFVRLLIASLPILAPCWRLSTIMSRLVPFFIVYPAGLSLLLLYDRVNNIFAPASLWHFKPLPMCWIT